MEWDEDLGRCKLKWICALSMDGVQMNRWRSMDGICTITGFMHYTDFLSHRMFDQKKR